MAKKNDSDPENLDGERDDGLEGLLGDFSDLLGDTIESSGEQEIDHDGMALSEILGDDVSHDDYKERPLEPETVDGDEDYASFLKDFDVLESEKKPEPEVVIESEEEKAASSDEDSVDIDLDFSSLSQEEGESAADDEESGEISFAGLDTAEETASGRDETTVDAVADDMGEPESDSAVVDVDLGLEDSDIEAPEADEEAAITIPSAEAEEEEDFLGLTDSVGKEQEKADFLDVDSGTSADVLFAGVEMDFDEQAMMVTRAELLLAQKKKDEAARLFKEVAEKKGKTFWVEKRLQQLS